MTTVTTNKVSPDLMTAMNPKKTSSDSVDEAQNRFMTLLVTQMKNQDPMNPMDNAQVTSQFAQLSTVSGINKMNDTLEALKGNYQASQTLQATSMIGHGVLAPGSSLSLQGGKAILGADFSEPVDTAVLTIRDAAGHAVRTMDLGGQQVGTVPVAWDGKTDKGETAPDGSYSFSIKATRGESTVAATALAFGQVTSVTTNSQGVKLSVPGMGNIGMSDVRQIL